MGYYSPRREVKLKSKEKEFKKGVLAVAAILTFVLSIFLGRVIGSKLLESRSGMKSPAAIEGYSSPILLPNQPPGSRSSMEPLRQNITAPPLVIPPPVVEPSPHPTPTQGEGDEGSTGPEKSALPNSQAKGASEKPAPAPSNTKYKVQTGLFSNAENARELAGLLREQGYRSGFEIVTRPQGAFYRVWVGPYDTRDESESTAQTLNAQGYQAFVFEATANSNPH